MGLERLFASAALIGSLSLGGCASTLSELTEGEGMTLVGAIMEESDDSLSVKLAPYVSLLGQMRYQKEVVREGRTQVNINQQTQNNPDNIVYSGNRGTPTEGYIWVNPDDPEDFSVKKILGSGFSFRWVDYNRNGFSDNDREFIERQSRFRQDESIALMLFYEAEESFDQDLRIYDPEGRPVLQYYIRPSDSRRGVCEYNLTGRCNNFSEDFSEESKVGMAIGLNRENISWLLETFGEGDYSATWRVDGKIMDSISFELIY